MAAATETRKVPGFSGVSLRGYGELEIEQRADAAGSETIVIEADQELLPRILTEVRGDRLVLGFSMPWYEWMTFWWSWLFLASKKIRFRLVAAKVEHVSISGAGRATAIRLESDRLDVGISGAGKVVLSAVKARELECRVSGAGNVEVSGSADRHDVRISGAGSVHAAHLATKKTTVVISGSGSLTANVAEDLDARISGAGSVIYEGTPRVSQRVTGAGKVRQNR
jgi:hypothetical protein